MFHPQRVRAVYLSLAVATGLLLPAAGAQETAPEVKKPADSPAAATEQKANPVQRQPATLPAKQATEPADPKQAAAADQPAEPKKAPEPEVQPEINTKEDARAAAMRSPVSSSQQLLLIFGVEPSHYEMLMDNKPLDLSEGEALLKMLYAVRKFKATHIFKWIEPKPDLEAVVANPGGFRGSIMKVWGYVTKIEEQQPLPEQITRFEMPRYYRCQMTTIGDHPQQVEIYTHQVPKAWLNPQTWRPPKGWRASIEGFFLKLSENNTLVFVSQRAAWHSRDMLGKLAMDVGLFDNVEDRKGITATDREAFYQMLYVVGNAGKNELARRTKILFDETEFKSTHIRDWPDFVRTLVVGSQMPVETAEHQVWVRLSPELQVQLTQLPAGQIPSKALQQKMVAELNAELSNRESQFFHPQAWQGDFLAPEGDALLAKAIKTLNTEDRQRLNRKLLETAFPVEIVAGDGLVSVADIRSPAGLAHKLKSESRSPTPLPGKQVWMSLSQNMRGKVSNLGENDSLDAHATSQLAGEISKALTRSTFYNNAAWQGYKLPDEVIKLLYQAVGNLSFSDRKRFRRLLLEAAFPELIAPTTEYSVIPLFNHPEAQRGRLLALYGTARRAIRIPVDDPDIQDRFKIDHYYEMEVFTDDSQSNPVTFCVRSLPKGMPEGEDIIEAVRVPAFFFKSWRYQSGVDKEKYPNRQKQIRLAPLLIGRQPIWIKPEPPPAPEYGLVAGLMFIGALSLVWLGVWNYARADERFHNEQISKNFTPEPGVSLNEVGIEVADEVHFRDYTPPGDGHGETAAEGDGKADTPDSADERAEEASSNGDSDTDSKSDEQKVEAQADSAETDPSAS